MKNTKPKYRIFSGSERSPSQKSKPDNGVFPFKLTSRKANAKTIKGRLAGEDIRGIEDIINNRHWEWREVDLPGLHRYLRALLAGWHPYANKGLKFQSGRDEGAFGVVRVAIEKELKKNPSMAPEEVWKTLKTRPPKGWKFFGSHASEFIDHRGGTTSKGTFRNTVREVRRGLLKKRDQKS